MIEAYYYVCYILHMYHTIYLAGTESLCAASYTIVEDPSETI